MATFVDTHAHLDDVQFASELEAVLERARQAGVNQIVTVATTAESSATQLTLAAKHPQLYPAVGIHPNSIAREPADAWQRVVALAERSEVVAIGETGLDRHWNDTPFPQQEDFFARHLDLAHRLDKPIIIHCREAEDDVLRLLREAHQSNGVVRGVLHSFVGSASMAEECRAMGLHLSFAGMLTYKNAADLRATAAVQPIDRLLVETDCPYLAPVPLRGKRNEPANVVHTAKVLADMLGLSVERVAAQTTANARMLFRLPEVNRQR